MKTLFRLKMLTLVVLTSLLFSCKNNKDGYSDEIQTNPNPVDSAGKERDTARSVNDNSVGVEDPQSMRSGNSERKTGEGSGPGPSANDGAAYTPSSGLQKDSIQPGTKKSGKKK